MLLSDTITHEDTSEAKLLLAKIRGDVARFEGAFHEIHRNHKTVEEKLVADLLENPDAAPPSSLKQENLQRLFSTLSSVDREVATITSRINDSFHLSSAEATTTSRSGALPFAGRKRTGPPVQLVDECCGMKQHIKLASRNR